MIIVAESCLTLFGCEIKGMVNQNTAVVFEGAFYLD
jgi:hypothetical protein